ncbi:hypothetical protein Tco_1355985, partial [Tanacetum coccineum]
MGGDDDGDDDGGVGRGCGGDVDGGCGVVTTVEVRRLDVMT